MTMIRDPHLVPVKPELFADLACPACGDRGVKAMGSVFPGIHAMGIYRCEGCGRAFKRDLPVGFAVDHPIAIDDAGQVIGSGTVPAWILDPLLKAHAAPDRSPVAIERVVHRRCKRIVLLNTMDFLYGHVLLKLFNAQHYLEHHPDLGLVLLLPRMYAWLAPKGAAEVWLVDRKLSQAQHWYTAIDGFVQERLKDYDEVYLGKSYAHPELDRLDIERFSGQRPFTLDDLITRPPHVTFVAREDRLWFSTPVHKFVFRSLNKLGLRGLARWIFVGAQQRMIGRAMRRIQRTVPGVGFSVVGLARAGGFQAAVEDLRTRTMSEAVERAWCAAYARSAVVVGVHGSNMLLPTAHAAGCVEILPHDRLGNLVQDISVRWNDRMQLFLYRFVDEFAAPAEVARHTASIFTDFATYHRANRVNVFHPPAPGR